MKCIHIFRAKWLEDLRGRVAEIVRNKLFSGKLKRFVLFYAPLILSAALYSTSSASSGKWLDSLKAKSHEADYGWTLVGRMAFPRAGAAVVKLSDDRVLIAGGESSSGYTRTVEIFDSTTGQSELINARLIAPRAHHTATVLRGGKILIVGGENAEGKIDSAEIFDPESQTFTLVKDRMNSARSHHTATLLPGGSVLIAGGSGNQATLDTTENYDAGLQRFTTAGRLSSKRSGHTAALLSAGRLMIAGGNDGTNDLDTVEMGDTNTLAFSPDEIRLPGRRAGAVAQSLDDDNTVMFVGGTIDGIASGRVESFSIFSAKTFPIISPAEMNISIPGSPLVTKSGALIFGGRDGGGNPLDAIESCRFASLRTDKKSYTTDESMELTGSGWMPDEDVEVLFVEKGSGHIVHSLEATADNAGGIRSRDMVMEGSRAGAQYFVIATGRSSGRGALAFVVLAGMNNYRLRATATGTQNWDSTTIWQKDNAGDLVFADTISYPGQSNDTGNVFIDNLSGRTIVLNVTPAFSIGSLTLGTAGVAAPALLQIGNDTTARTLDVDGDIRTEFGTSSTNSGRLEINSASNAVHFIFIGGDLINAGKVDLSDGNDSLCEATFDKAGSQVIGTTGGSSSNNDFFTLRINSGSTVTLQRSVRLDRGSLIISGTYDIGSFTSNRVNGSVTLPAHTKNLTVNNGGILRIGGTGGLPTNFTPDTQPGSTVEYYGSSGTQFFSVGTYNGSVVFSGGNKSGSGDVTVHENLIINSGLTVSIGPPPFSSSPSTLTINGSMSRNDGTLNVIYLVVGDQAADTLTNNGTITIKKLSGQPDTPVGGMGKLMQSMNSALNLDSPSVTPTLDAAASGNTVNYNLDGGSQTIKATTYHHLTLTSISTSLAPMKDISGVSQVNGNFTLTGPASSQTLSVTPTTGMNIGGNFAINNRATFNAAAFAHTIMGNLSNNASGIFNGDSSTVNLKGNWSNSGSFNAGTSTFVLNGTIAQTMSGSTFNNLTTANSAGIDLLTDETVGGTLTLQQGNIRTAANKMIVTGSVTRNSGHIVGNLQKNVPIGSSAISFEVGTGADYTPVSVSFTNVTTGDTLTGTTTASEHPNLSSSDLDSTRGVNRFWTLTPGASLAFANYNATITFVDGDKDAGANTSNFVVRKFSAGSWVNPSSSAAAANSTTGNGFTSFSDFVAGEVRFTNTIVADKTATFSDSNQAIMMTATVTSSSTVNEGTVLFEVKDGPTAIGMSASGSVVNGSASANYTLPGGTGANTYTIEASYSGSGIFPASTDSATLTVDKAPTITDVANKTADFSASDQTVILTATVTGSVVNQGTVTFQVKNGMSNVGMAVESATLTDGNASVNYTLPGGTPVGVHTIEASYSGGSNFTPSLDTGILSVGQLATATALSASPTPSCLGEQVTFTATVTATSGAPTGTVTFKEGMTMLGTGMLSGGVATFMTSGLSAGLHSITASYGGDENFMASMSTALAHAVDTAPSVTVNPSNALVCAGNPASFTAAASGSPVPSVQWQVSTDGGSSFTNIPGATSNTLMLTASAMQSGNKYRAVFTNHCGLVATGTAMLISFDFVIQDDSTGNKLFLNSLTGDYFFCLRDGFTLPGKGVINRIGNTVKLTQGATESNRRVSATLDAGTNRGIASLQFPVGQTRCSITDRNTTNNSCSCGASSAL